MSVKFSIATPQLYMKQWINVKPHYVQAQEPRLSPKVSFTRIDPADWIAERHNGHGM